jgi:hypothetical protein
MGLMSDEDRSSIGSDKSRGIARRVGNADRDEAIALLAEHWHAGRLDPGEHELRVTKAKVAVTRADLDALFVDLPRPGPQPVPTGAVTPAGGRGLLANLRETIMALSPFAALFLFFTTGSWMWFLMIPVMGILLYGPDRESNGGQGRSRRRNRNRSC